MNLYRDLKKRSLLLCLPLSLLLLAISALYAPMTFDALADGGLVLAFPAIVMSWPWGIWGLYRIVYALCGGYQRRVRSYVAGAPNPAETLAALEEAYAAAEPIKRLRLCGAWVFLQKGPATHLYEIGEILWVYQLNKSVTQFFVTTTRRFLVVGLANRMRIKCRMSELQIQQCMNAFAAVPTVVRGYRDSLSSLFNNNIAEFMRLAHSGQLQKDIVLDYEE